MMWFEPVFMFKYVLFSYVWTQQKDTELKKSKYEIAALKMELEKVNICHSVNVMYGCALFKNSCIHDTHNVVECPIVHGHTMSTPSSMWSEVYMLHMYKCHLYVQPYQPSLNCVWTLYTIYMLCNITESMEKNIHTPQHSILPGDLWRLAWGVNTKFVYHTTMSHAPVTKGLNPYHLW